jgi:hypothetical protein
LISSGDLEEGEGEEEDEGEEEEWREDSVEGSQSPRLQDYLCRVDQAELNGYFIPKNMIPMETRKANSEENDLE